MSEIKITYQLIFQFPIRVASADEFDRIIGFEAELGLILRGDHKVEGHQFGATGINIVVQTPSPSVAFELAKRTLLIDELDSMRVAYKDKTSDTYVLLWPLNFVGQFSMD